jgi:hypothetical protein
VATFRVYEEDEFFAAPVEEWLSEAAAPAPQPRFRRLAGGALIAGAIFAVGGALAFERLPAPGGSRAGAMVGADGSRTRYLAAGSASAPIRARFFASASQGSSSPPARASWARAGAAAKGHPRAPKAQVVAARVRMAARAGSVRTRASSSAAPASVAVAVAATATAGQGPVSAPRVAAVEPAAGASAAADGRPVASASGGASRREHPEFGFER